MSDRPESRDVMTEERPRIDARQFIDNVVASGLLDRPEVERALESFPPTERAKAVARHLISVGKLTKFQAERLLIGKTDGFQLGQYRVLEEVGRGGMGRVYKAVHQIMGRHVALKVLAPELTKTERARELFLKEIRGVARLNHANIVLSYDANRAGDRCFLVMEFVDGPNLSQLVKDQGPLPVEQACEYIRQTAIGLDYAHNLGFVHRDIKPSNILIQASTTGPLVKILDFGLAIITIGEEAAGELPANTPHTVLGTPDYVSPEQAKNHRQVDGRSDLYSLGCTFYYLLTGEVPFPGGTALEKIVRHNSEAPTSVQTRRPEVPDAIANVVHKLLAKNPVWRYQTAGELAAELGALVSGKADWSAPARPSVRPKSESVVSLTTGDDPWEHVDVEEPSSSTLPTAMMSTRETPAVGIRPRKRPPARKKLLWPWVILAVILAFGVVTGVGLAVRYILNHLG
jgi:eukaryotic-like serine/threonine-protein kinase